MFVVKLCRRVFALQYWIAGKLIEILAIFLQENSFTNTILVQLLSWQDKALFQV